MSEELLQQSREILRSLDRNHGLLVETCQLNQQLIKMCESSRMTEILTERILPWQERIEERLSTLLHRRMTECPLVDKQ